MKVISSRFVLIAIALLASIPVCAQTYNLTVTPDTVIMRAVPGDMVDAFVQLSDGRDSLHGYSPIAVHLYFSDNNQHFHLLSDSVVSLLGQTTVHIRFSPVAIAYSNDQLEIESDSLRFPGVPYYTHISVIGYGVSSYPPSIAVASYDSLVVGNSSCAPVIARNPNPDTMWITSLAVTDDPKAGTQWSLLNPVQNYPIAGNNSATIANLCALATGFTPITGLLRVGYRYHSTIGFDTIALSGRTPPLTECVIFSDTDFGVVPEGYQVEQSIVVTNRSSQTFVSTKVYAVSGDTSNFHLGDWSGMLISPGGTWGRLIRLSVPPESAKYEYSATYAVESFGSLCATEYFTVIAHVTGPAADTIVLDVPPGTDPIEIRQHLPKQDHALFLRNVVPSSRITVPSIAIDDSSGLAYFGSPGNETLRVEYLLMPDSLVGPFLLTVDVSDTLPHDFSMTVNYNLTLQSGTYHIVAQRVAPLAAVRMPNTSQALDFTLSPNPARDDVTIALSNDEHATVEIYDVLGNLVYRQDATSEMTWSPKAASGIYIVRVSQHLATGSIAISSKRLVFER